MEVGAAIGGRGEAEVGATHATNTTQIADKTS